MKRFHKNFEKWLELDKAIYFSKKGYGTFFHIDHFSVLSDEMLIGIAIKKYKLEVRYLGTMLNEWTISEREFVCDKNLYNAVVRCVNQIERLADASKTIKEKK